MPRGWGKLRAQVLRRDGHTCRHCGGVGSHVDHVIPAALGGTDETTNLQTLCGRCHATKTGRESAAIGNARRRLPTEQHPGLID